MIGELVNKILEVRKFRGLSRNKVEEELGEIKEQQGTLDDSLRQRFHEHQITKDGVVYIAYDAKALNRHMNQNRRGCFRYLYDRVAKKFNAIAEEKDSGAYDLLVKAYV